MGQIAFTTITAPVATDAADGATGFNIVAQVLENNLDLVNQWAIKAAPIGLSGPVVEAADMFTAGAGWASSTKYVETQPKPTPPYTTFVPPPVRTYGRKWGPFTYVSIAVQRTGAAFGTGAGGNLTDMLIGTLAVAFRPLRTYVGVAGYDLLNGCEFYIGTNGAVWLTAMAEEEIDWGSEFMLISAAWLNLDPQVV
jgi:hypothetical protein